VFNTFTSDCPNHTAEKKVVTILDLHTLTVINSCCDLKGLFWGLREWNWTKEAKKWCEWKKKWTLLICTCLGTSIVWHGSMMVVAGPPFTSGLNTSLQDMNGGPAPTIMQPCHTWYLFPDMYIQMSRVPFFLSCLENLAQADWTTSTLLCTAGRPYLYHEGSCLYPAGHSPRLI